MSRVSVPIVQLPHGSGLPLPQYATEHSAGCDLVAAIDAPILLEGVYYNRFSFRSIVLSRIAVPTGIAIALPIGYEAQVRPRSGLAAQGIIVPNSPGTIDADYRGEIKVLLANFGSAPFVIERGMRIAQLIIAPVMQTSWQPVASLDETRRGENGFGSTGLGANAQ